MKQIFRLLSAIMIACIFSACGGKDEPMEGPNYHRGALYRMHLKLQGDYVEDYDLPLTRAMNSAPKDMYIGINIKKKEGNKESRYAYGVFDDINNIYINLYSGEKYSFEVTVIKNGTEKLQLVSANFSYPFRKNGGAQYLVGNVNEFQYSETDYLAYLNSGTAQGLSQTDSKDGKAMQEYRYPRMHRYYGEVKDFGISSQQTDVAVDMTYECFGLRIIADHLPEGSTLTWQESSYDDNNRGNYLRFDSDCKLVYDSDKENGSGYLWEDVYSLNSFSNAEKKVTLKFTLNRSDGTKKTFSSSELTMTRGLRKVLKVVIDGNVNATGSHIEIGDLTENLVNENTEEIKVNL